MKRLYFLVDDLETASVVSRTLHHAGITDWNFHAISRDEAGLDARRVRSAMPWQQLDFIHTGARWALTGVGIAAFVGIAMEAVQPLPMRIEVSTILLFCLLCGCFGAWLGGMVGVSRENYKLAPFHAELDAGQTLILVDVAVHRVDEIRTLMAERFPKAHFAGMDSPFINPLERPREVYPQTTH